MKKAKKPPTRKAPKPTCLLDKQLSLLFWTLGPAYSRWVELTVGKCGTTPQRLRLIGLLCENGPMMMSELRDELGVTGTNITALTDALEKEGKLLRKPHPTDRRITLIEVTSQTKSRFATAIGEFRERVGELFMRFDKKEKESFLSYLEKMRDALVERGILVQSHRK